MRFGDTEEDSAGSGENETAINDDSTASTAEMPETDSSTTRSLRSGSITEDQNLEVEITNHDAECHALAVIPDRAHETDALVQVTGSCDHRMIHLSLQGTSGHVTYLRCQDAHQHCQDEAVQHDISRPGAPQAHVERLQVKSRAAPAVASLAITLQAMASCTTSPLPRTGFDSTCTSLHANSIQPQDHVHDRGSRARN